ncbi:VanZ family protein, partial [Enterococcus innesii]|uniref:VanZ family protein n=1 Tax=Enterococcus innesii TaxID=2839759 RepID=UPI0032E44DFD
SLKTLYRKRTVIWPFYFYTIIRTLSDLLSAVVLLNIVMFIPNGFLFKFNKKNLLLFILVIFLVEISQYVFALGIFDFGDIFTNTCGFIIGSAISETPLFSNFKEKIR